MGDCQIHITATDPCEHCAAAAKQTAKALADVVPVPARKRTTSQRASAADEARVRELRAAGLSFGQIAKRVPYSTTTVAAIVNGGRYGQKPRLERRAS